MNLKRNFFVTQDEAFSLWKQHWASLYPEGSTSRNVIDEIHDSYCLVNLVDNDFVRDNCLFDIIRKTINRKESHLMQNKELLTNEAAGTRNVSSPTKIVNGINSSMEGQDLGQPKSPVHGVCSVETVVSAGK